MSDAVVHPRTVMVHFENTKSALTAVVSPRRLPRLLSNALGAVLDLVVLALERRSETLRDAARVREGSPQVADVGKEAEAIEDESVEAALHCQRDPLNELLVNHFLLVPVENVRSVTNVLSIHD